jgi:hypothetical protein
MEGQAEAFFLAAADGTCTSKRVALALLRESPAKQCHGRVGSTPSRTHIPNPWACQGHEIGLRCSCPFAGLKPVVVYHNLSVAEYYEHVRSQGASNWKNGVFELPSCMNPQSV